MRIVFMGTPAPAVPSLERIIADGHDVVAVYTQPDRPAGRGNKLSAPPVKDCASAHGIEVLQPLKIRTPEALATFRGHAADVAVVVAYGRILPQTFLEAFPHGALNVHFSLLPKLRGAAPVNWAIVGGDSTTGVTTMQMDVGLDTGDVILQRETPIGESENAVELMSRLAGIGAELLSETLRGLATLPRVAQDHALATLAPIMKKEDGLIDWNLDATSISNRIRGFQPFPTSFTRSNGLKLTIWQASAEAEPVSAAAGTIVEARAGRLAIACGGGTCLAVTELQLEGKKRMAVRDFLNGVRIQAGDRLGE